MSDARSSLVGDRIQHSSDPAAATTDLRGRVALVTGVGRRRGIGSAICRALAARGADVFFSHWKDYDRAAPMASDEDEPEALLEELRATGVRAGRSQRRSGTRV
jgi:NAD(P)-dependent dehydrogenase (short-subunit alcohol dehydrogenase family)